MPGPCVAKTDHPRATPERFIIGGWIPKGPWAPSGLGGPAGPSSLVSPGSLRAPREGHASFICRAPSARRANSVGKYSLVPPCAPWARPKVLNKQSVAHFQCGHSYVLPNLFFLGCVVWPPLGAHDAPSRCVRGSFQTNVPPPNGPFPKEPRAPWLP